MQADQSGPTGSIVAKLAYRAYLFILRYEALFWLRVRSWLITKMTGRKSQALNLFPDVFIEDYHGLSIGDHVSINRGSNLSAGGGLTIGDYVSIGHATSIVTADHGFQDPDKPIKYQPTRPAPVRIGSNVWIGARVIILSGVEIAEGTVIAAGAVVTKSVIEPNTIVGGVPARKLKGRFD